MLEPTRDIPELIFAVFIVLVLVFFAIKFYLYVNGPLELMAVIPLGIAAFGAGEAYKAWEKKPREPRGM